MLIRDKNAFRERVGEVEGLSFKPVTHWLTLDQHNEPGSGMQFKILVIWGLNKVGELKVFTGFCSVFPAQ